MTTCAATRRRRASLAVLVSAFLLSSSLAFAAQPKLRPLSASGTLRITEKPGAFMAVQAGRITGKPFGSGRMVLRSTLKQAMVTCTFTLTTAAGKVTGTALARLVLDGDTATYTGTAKLAGGTGRYSKISGSNIKFTGVGPVNGQRTDITFSGRVRY